MRFPGSSSGFDPADLPILNNIGRGTAQTDQRNLRAADMLPIADTLRGVVVTLPTIVTMSITFATNGCTSVLTAMEETLDKAASSIETARAQLRKLKRKYSE